MDAAAAGLPSMKVANPQPPVAAYFVESLTINRMFVGGPGRKTGLGRRPCCFRRRDVTVVQSGNDRAVRERKLPLAVGLDRHIVALNGANTVQVAFFVGAGDPPPVSVLLSLCQTAVEKLAI